MNIFKRNKKKTGGIADVIRCDEKDYLVWKWHPSGDEQGELKRETAIRTNSILRVKEGEVAVFVYKQKDGTLQDFIVGPHDEKLKTKNFPVLSSLIGLWYESDTPFQAEVFFINVSNAIQLNFGVPYFDVLDPRYTDFQVPVAVRGTLTFKIDDYKEFIKIHQLVNFSLEDLKNKISSSVIRNVKDVVTNAPAENNIPVIALESKIDLINEKVEIQIKDRLIELFGVAVTGIDISAIEVDKSSSSYQELKRITKDITTGQVENELLDYQERLRIDREEGQYAQRMSTRQQNLGAYQTEVSGQVGVAGAEALGKMGESGAGNINLGRRGSGFNPTTIIAGMAVGKAVGENIAGTLKQATNQAEGKPPTVPVTRYFVAKEDKATGPFDIDTLKNMITAGEFVSESLVWKEGMPTWEYANTQTELKGLFPPKITK